MHHDRCGDRCHGTIGANVSLTLNLATALCDVIVSRPHPATVASQVTPLLSWYVPLVSVNDRSIPTRPSEPVTDSIEAIIRKLSFSFTIPNPPPPRSAWGTAS